MDVLYAVGDILKYAETVMLNGDGEPFLYPDIDRSLELFRKYGVRVGTNTNFTVVPENVWGYLADGFSFINISCDGSEKELYERIRKGLSFDDFTANLSRLDRTDSGSEEESGLCADAAEYQRYGKSGSVLHRSMDSHRSVFIRLA